MAAPGGTWQAWLENLLDRKRESGASEAEVEAYEAWLTAEFGDVR